jgi:hypothetical protein
VSPFVGADFCPRCGQQGVAGTGHTCTAASVCSGCHGPKDFRAQRCRTCWRESCKRAALLPKLDVRDRFMEKVDKTETCWLWRAFIEPKGYGRFRQKLAHRVSYEMHVGPIPDGLTLDHLCRVRHCVNPAHLEPVTAAENTRRGKEATKTHCKHGHLFDEANTIHIVDRAKGGKRACRTCARAAKQRHYLRKKAQAA